MHLVCHREELLEELYEDVLRGIYTLVILMAEHLDARIDEENAKHAEYPLKLVDDGRTGKDEDAA